MHRRFDVENAFLENDKLFFTWIVFINMPRSVTTLSRNVVNA